MADYFFTASNVDTDKVTSQSYLSTTYTAALSTYLQGTAADYIGFLAYTVNETTLEEALAIVDAVAAGQFTLADLFAAAQTKTLTGDVDNYEAGIADASPKLIVNGITIDLTAILSDPDVAYWLTTTKKEGTIYHLREFYTAADAPEGYGEGWAESNSAPVVTGPVEATVDEDDEDVTIDLLANASDADLGDDMDVEGLAYTVTGGTWAAPVAYTADPETGALTIEPAQFNSLRADETVQVTFTYNVIDGNGGVTPATAVITITGSNDAATITVSDTEDNSVTEDSDSAAGGQLSVDDVDNGEGSFASTSNLNGTYGSFTFNTTDGVWGYTLNDADNVQALAKDEKVTDTLTVTSDDGTTHDIVVEITGTKDLFTGNAIGSLTLAKTNGANGNVKTGTITVDSSTLQGFDWNFKADVTGVGDYNAGNEGFTVTGDVGASYIGSGTNGGNESLSSVNPTNETLVSTAWYSDGDLDVTVTFAQETASSSNVTVALTYDYWL